MTASSTSSSEPRARTRHRLALASAFVAAAALLGGTVPLNRALVEREFASSAFGRTASAAADVAGGRPLVPVLGSSQTESAIQALRVEQAVAPHGERVVADVCTGGLHASVYPELLRYLADHAQLEFVVLELGHIAHDQYGGAFTVRNFLTDAPVREAFAGTPRGASLLRTWNDENRFPWLATPRLLRVVYDSERRETFGAIAPRMRASRGFSAYTQRKDFDQVVRTLEHDPAYDAPDLLDASPQKVFVEVARACAELCRARGVGMAVYLHPVNREVVPRIKVVRHFEETARSETIPALRALGIDVMVPPDRFFDASLYYDHVHLLEPGAREFSDWFAGELAKRLPAR